MTPDDFSRNGTQTGHRVQERCNDPLLVQIEGALRGLRFGQVTISVQDGVIVQIERIERTRLRSRCD